MRAIALQSARTALALLLVYIALIGLSLLLYPRSTIWQAVDTARAGETVYETQAKYLIFSRSPLRTPGERVVFLGASNTGVGFPVAMVQRALRGAHVNNLAMNGANGTQIREAFDLARIAIPPASRARTVYVVGLWYGLFVADAIKWPHPAGQRTETEIDNQRYRYGFYYRTPAGPVEVIPDTYFGQASLAIYPLVVFEKVARVLSAPIRQRFLGAQPDRTAAERNAYVPTANDKRDKVRFWHESFAGTTIAGEQFAALQGIIDQAKADGSAVMLVDLPIPTWHAAAVPYDRRYAAMMQAFVVAQRGNPSVSYLSLRDMDDDSWFSDEVHPKPRIVTHWIARIAPALDAAVARLAPQGMTAGSGEPAQ